MKFKSSLAILSCTAIALSIGVPSIAETVKDSQVKSSSIGIGNKQLVTNNDRAKSGLVGYWRSSTTFKNGTPVEVFCNFRLDGIEDCSYTNSKGTSKSLGTWAYANGNWISSYPSEELLYSIEWISNNEIVFRKIQGSGGSLADVQRYYRQQQSTSQRVTPKIPNYSGSSAIDTNNRLFNRTFFQNQYKF